MVAFSLCSGGKQVKTLVPKFNYLRTTTLDFLQLNSNFDSEPQSAEVMENSTEVILGGVGAQFSRVMSRARVLGKAKVLGRGWDVGGLQL